MSVYILKCKKNKYYVGWSNQVLKRINSHYIAATEPDKWHPSTKNRPKGYPYGSVWTRMYSVVDIISVEKGDRDLENQRTLEMMLEHGYENVRGGRYCYRRIYHEPKGVDRLRQCPCARS